jgi:signal transduction histidine kinase
MLVALLTVSITSFFSNALIERRFRTYMETHQTVKAESMAENLRLQYDARTETWDRDALHTLGMYSLSDGYIIKVYDKAGAMLWDAENHDMAQCQRLMETISLRMEEHGASGDFMTRAFPLTQDGAAIGSVRVSYFGPYFLDENDFGFLRALYGLLTAAGVVSLLLAFVTGLALARRIARPIARTSDIAKQIGAGNYDIRFEGRTKTKELHDLISSINQLADALARQEKLRRQLTADVAHELRTPLATLGAHLEAMIEGVWEPAPERLASCHEEILRLGKTVADLERLERTESDNLKLDRTPADLLALARSVCGNFPGELANKRLRLDITGEPAVAAVDTDRIRSVVSNLMSNAVKYTPAGGHIRIAVQNTPETVVFSIADDGAGIPKEELPFIFERFYRADKSRNRDTGGAGIGLAIVKSVVAAHGGSIAAESGPDQGSCFTVTLPKNPCRM